MNIGIVPVILVRTEQQAHIIWESSSSMAKKEVIKFHVHDESDFPLKKSRDYFFSIREKIVYTYIPEIGMLPPSYRIETVDVISQINVRSLCFLATDNTPRPG